MSPPMPIRLQAFTFVAFAPSLYSSTYFKYACVTSLLARLGLHLEYELSIANHKMFFFISLAWSRNRVS